MITRDKIQNRPMNFLGGLFSGGMGAGFEAERAASPEQAQQLYNQQQDLLKKQRQFATALGAQTPEAIAAQRALLTQLRGQAMGTAGPSVAQRQLAQTTGENIAAQQALMAGQRGASANVGQMARQASLAGGRAQQQAAGQAATLRAQEQLAAQQALSGLTGQQIGQVAGAQQLGLQATQGAQQNVLDAIARQNAVNVAMAQQNQQFQAGLVGGLLGGGATLATGKPMAFAEGGEVKKEKNEYEDYWDSFTKQRQAQMDSRPMPQKAGAKAGQGIAQGIGSLFGSKQSVTGQPKGGYAGANLGVSTQMPQAINPMATSQSIGAFRPGFEKGGKVPAMVSPGERYLPPHEVEQVKRGQKEPHRAGKAIPGEAKIKGDSLKNDTVPATLEEGGIVIPRSVMQSKNPAEKARQFVAAVLAKQSLKRK